MSKDIKQEVNALVTQCESALNRFAKRTGAPIFAAPQQDPALRSSKKIKPVSDRDLEKIAKSLKTSCADSSEHMAKLNAKGARKADNLKALQLQRQALVHQQEQAKQAGLVKKRKSMYRDQNTDLKISQASSTDAKDDPSKFENITFGNAKSNNLRRK